MSVQVSSLVKIFRKQRAVDDISFSATKGEILGFLGPNGAGKSTTMKMITGYIPPSSGRISVAGFDVATQAAEVKKKVGYLPEHNPLYLDMYVREYLGFMAGLHGIGGAQRNARIKDIIDQVGLGLEQHKKIGALSKGYRQRVGLGQAMLHDPQVLILDEPTTGLDPNQIVEIRELIRSLGKEKTVIFSTHIMQEVQALCHRVIVINHGKLVADNPVEELKSKFSPKRVIIAEFESEIDIRLFAQLSFLEEVKVMGNGKYHLITEVMEDVRPEVFRLASDNALPLRGLQVEEQSLEQIFRQITK